MSSPRWIIWCVRGYDRRGLGRDGSASGTNGYVTSFWVSPDDLTAEALAELLAVDTDATLRTMRLSPQPGGAAVSAWVRYHSSKRLPAEVCHGLNQLTGRQLAAVRASLPAPVSRSPLVVPTRTLDEHETLTLPLGPAAQPTIPR